MVGEIQFFYEDVDENIFHENLIRKWIIDCINVEHSSPGDINIVFCTDSYLYDLNMEYLNHDTLTDIITFQYSNENEPLSGDIFISLDRVQDNANDFSAEFDHELNRVIIHGVLHLIGYKDKTDAEKEQMRSKEDYYLSLLS